MSWLSGGRALRPGWPGRRRMGWGCESCPATLPLAVYHPRSVSSLRPVYLRAHRPMPQFSIPDLPVLVGVFRRVYGEYRPRSHPAVGIQYHGGGSSLCAPCRRGCCPGLGQPRAWQCLGDSLHRLVFRDAQGLEFCSPLRRGNTASQHPCPSHPRPVGLPVLHLCVPSTQEIQCGEYQQEVS